LAIKSGAWDYIQKTNSPKEIMLPLMRVIQYREGFQNKKVKKVALDLNGIIGSSNIMKNCYDLLAQAANTNLNVLITGETGTGKELFATAIHRNSDRASKNFVVVDCAALPETLVESLLFGYKKGAFSGAVTQHDGLVKQADGGTLFLDEVGELTPSAQKKFLRVLQERRFRAIGGKEEIEVDFRLIAATNKNLEDMAEKKQFRKDLLFRLKSLHLDLPPLRDHREDITDLALYHTTRLCVHMGTEFKGFSPEFFEAIEAYPWPGNVRELVKALESVLAASLEEPVLFPKHLPQHIRIQISKKFLKPHRPDIVAAADSHMLPAPLPTLKDYRVMTEKKYFETLIHLTKGDIKKSCRIAGISRSGLYAYLNKNRITPTG
jgi:two-component system, NtrC family, response regulator